MRQGNAEAEAASGQPHEPGGHHPSGRRRLSLKFAALMRWLHIYISMLSLAIVLFFSVTGITLNHPDWFFGEAESTAQLEGDLDRNWLHLKADEAPKPEGDSSNAEVDHGKDVDKLKVVEFLRATHKIGGALADFRVDEAECTVTFKGPGYSADAFIERESGHYRLSIASHGFIAVINDLHKGRDTGPTWSVVIDVSAVFMTLVSITGFVLIFYLKLRRRPGLVVGLIGLVLAALLYWLGVP